MESNETKIERYFLLRYRNMFTGLFLYRKEAGVWECNFSVLNKPSLHSALVNVITEDLVNHRIYIGDPN